MIVVVFVYPEAPLGMVRLAVITAVSPAFNDTEVEGSNVTVHNGTPLYVRSKLSEPSPSLVSVWV